MKSVIGLGFGDEGKGLTTNFLSKKHNISLIIRHSGGHQAGHNVVFNNKNHIFSNFGSGSFQNIPTYWSNYCTVDPIGLVNEFKILLNFGLNPIIYIDANSPITTPFEKIKNTCSINNLKHGTCGVGFGATFEREDNFYSLVFSDIYNEWILKEKIENIKKYYYNNISIDDDYIYDFYESINYIILHNENFRLTYGIPDKFKTNDNILFEGSQGLLLDQHFGFFPHVTRTNTGTKNILNILNNNNINNYNIDYYLITRAYQTRHGNGPMSNKNIDIDINNTNETNVTNKYQGDFKKSILDVSLLEYGINKDINLKNSKNKNLVITCLDHITEYVFTYNNKLIICDNENDFINKISNILNIHNVYISKSNISENILKYK